MIEPFAMVPNFAVEMASQIGALPIAVYTYLCYRSGKDRTCYPSYGKIAKDLKITKPTAIKCIDVLVSVGLVVIVRKGNPAKAEANLYHLPSKRTLPGKDDPSKGDLPDLVNDVNHPSKGDLPQQDSFNKNQFNKKDERGDPSKGDLLGDPFEALQLAYEQGTGLTISRNDIDAINDAVKAGATPQDVKNAIAYFSGDGKVVTSFSRLKGSINYSIGKRTQAPPDKKNGKKGSYDKTGVLGI